MTEASRTITYISDVPIIADANFVGSVTAKHNTYGAELRRMMKTQGMGVTSTGDPEMSRRFFGESRAQEYIDDVAVYRDDVLDIHATADGLGIPIAYVEKSHPAGFIGGTGIYRGESPLQISLYKDLRSRKTITFGHEIGHYFLDEVVGNVVDGFSHEVERFCEFFGRAMALPKRALEDVEYVDEQGLLDLKTKHQVELSTTIFQLIQTGKLPRRVAVDSSIGETKNPEYSDKISRNFVCLHCGETGGDRNCPNVGADGRLFDFTDRSWSLSLPTCVGEGYLGPAELAGLTRYYETKSGQLPLFRPMARYGDV